MAYQSEITSDKAAKYFLGAFSAYQKCSMDVKCASRIIRSYMTAFAQDCNGDGLVTCDDYAMIHKSGGWSCTNNIQSTEYWQIYSDCKSLINQRGENI